MDVAIADRESDLCRLGVDELSRRYRDGSLSPVEVTRATLDRIANLQPKLNAFITVLNESALAAASSAERLLQAGIDLGPLQGVPVTTKDIVHVRHTRTTCASPQLIDAPPDNEDATVITRLRRSGAVLVGKTHLWEFAGPAEKDGPFGWAQNPRRLGYQTEGSSSGAAAATAAGLGVIALGTDTGGSIRLPAAFCGVVGLKPTYGRVPVHGVVPLSATLDHVGPLTRTVADAAYGLQVIAGDDSRDPYSAPVPVDDYVGRLHRDVRGLRVGVPVNDFFQDAQPAVLRAFSDGLAAMHDLGLVLRDFDLPRVEEMPDLTELLIIKGEAAAYHERYRGREDRYAPIFRDFVLEGRDVKAISYIQARETMADIKADWSRLFDEFDVIATPSCPIVAPPNEVSQIEVDGSLRDQEVLTPRFTCPFNAVGFPALTMPAGITPDGLPTSVQLVAPPFAEARLLAVASALENALGVAAQLGIDVRE